MFTLKFSRLVTLVTVFVVALLAAACSPSATTPTSAPSTSGETADPAAAVKGFYDALYTGGDVASFVCSAAGVDKAQLEASYKSAVEAMTSTGAKVDTSGLTYTASNITADKATVTVGGNLSVEMAGQKSESPMPDTPINVTKEGDSWKICA